MGRWSRVVSSERKRHGSGDPVTRLRLLVPPLSPVLDRGVEYHSHKCAVPAGTAGNRGEDRRRENLRKRVTPMPFTAFDLKTSTKPPTRSRKPCGGNRLAYVDRECQ
jgi:hypothetical protein